MAAEDRPLDGSVVGSELPKLDVRGVREDVFHYLRTATEAWSERGEWGPTHYAAQTECLLHLASTPNQRQVPRTPRTHG